MIWSTLVIIFVLTALACIAFTLTMMWISELSVRLLRRTRPQMPKTVFRITLPTIAVTVGVLTYGFRTVFSVMKTGDDLGFQVISVVHAIVYAVGGFACVLFIVWGIGQRSKGRKRCPKCWYSMEGVPNLTCPECGKSARSEAKLFKSRRARWIAFSASVLLAASVYGFVRADEINKHGALMLVPTRVLMLGWEQFPESWILAKHNVSGSLERRLISRPLSAESRSSFLRSLLVPMLTSRRARLDPDRTDLINACTRNWWELEVGDDHDTWRDHPSYNILIDTDKLLLLTAQDLYDALVAKNPSAEQLVLLGIFSQMRTIMPFEITAIIMTREDMRQQEGVISSDQAYEMSAPSTIRRYQSALAPLRDQLRSQAFVDGSIRASNDDEIMLGIDLVFHAGLATELIDTYADSPRAGVPGDGIRGLGFGFGTEMIHPDDAPAYIAKINNLLASDQEHQRIFAIETAYYSARIHKRDSMLLNATGSDEFIRLLRDAAALQPQGPLILGELTFPEMAHMTLLKLDHDPYFTWPIVRRMIERDPKNFYYVDLYSESWELLLERTGADEQELGAFFADQFAQYATHSEEDLRYWYLHQIKTIPPGTNGIIDESARRLLEMPNDGYVQPEAWRHLRAYAEHLDIVPLD